VTGRHHRPPPEDVAAVLQGWYAGLDDAGWFRPPPLCPRCGSDRVTDCGEQAGCGRCGATWQADAPIAGPPEPRRPDGPAE
jgi:ribosomal protein S27AE